MDGQEVAEKMRQDVKKDMEHAIKTTPSYKVQRFVDGQVLEKTIVHQYGKFNSVMKKADYDERQHARRGNQTANTVVGGRLNVFDVPLDLSVERTYFETFGHGFRTEHPDQIHQQIYCRHCGLKYVGDPALQDLTCPRCGTPTPIGEIVNAGGHKRW